MHVRVVAKTALALAIMLVLAVLATGSAQAQTFTTLHSFDGTDGSEPGYTAPVQATDGNFYGTTETSGANGYGTVYRITPSGTLTTLYSFCSQVGCADGVSPMAGLIQATDGNFYGPTSWTVFEITPSGTLTTLDAVSGQPWAALVQGTDGNFYGTTICGGTNPSECGGVNVGTVYKITPGGTLTTLHNFDGTDGNGPYGGRSSRPLTGTSTG